MTTPQPGTPPPAARPAAPAVPEWVLLDLHPCPLLLADATTGRIVRGNAAAREAALYPPGAGAYAADDRGRIEADELARVLLGRDNPGGAEITWHTPDRQSVFRVFVRPVPPADGSGPLTALVFLDVTGEKRAEAELREALEARDEFFSVATHELKDPLFSLQLSIQLLRHSAQKFGDIPAHVRQHLEVSQRQSDRLARLIENMLDVSRIINDRVRLDVEAVDLAALARDVVGRWQAQAQTSGTPLAAEADAPLVVYADRLKLEQVLDNLLSNALKYGAGKPVAVRVRGEGGAALLEVADHGNGIAPEDQERVFRRFERASNGHRRLSLGLGLYIVRSFVEAHGGTVALTSEPGRGATFTVTLPRP